MKTRISLFSKNEALVRFMQASVAEGLGKEFTLEVKAPGQIPSGQDLCIWDFVPGETIFPQALDQSEWRKHLFLLHRKNLGVLRSIVGVSDVNMLLKPVTRAALRAFLGGYGLHNLGSGDDSRERLARQRGERDDLLQFLMQANLRLQEFHQEQTNFLTRSIHDFRAPLTAISGYCDLLLDEELESLTEGQRKILQRMQQSAGRLTRATDSMFQLGIAESASPAGNLERADMRDSIGQVLEDLAAVLENKRVTVTVDVEPSPENLLFETSQIRQVLANLLETACKFTPRRGVVAIRGYPYFWERRTDRAVSTCFPDRQTGQSRMFNSFRVDISDSGLAVPAVDADKIFEEYTSYSGGQDRSGAGLGMGICRMILSQHNGRIWAEGTEAGAVYSFVLPLS